MSLPPRLLAERLTGFAQGPRWAQWALPAAGTAARGGVLMVQSFLDEQPLGRRVLSAMARRLAGDGWTVLMADLFGTGDSAGDHADASLDQWRDDLDRACALLRARARDPAPVLIGARLGALLATDLVGRLPVPPRAVVLWNPPASGAALIDPLRRLGRLGAVGGAGATVAGGEAGATGGVRASPVDGGGGPGRGSGAGRLAGYPVAPALIEALRALRLDRAPAATPAVGAPWLAVQGQRVAEPGQPAPAALQAAAQAWQAAGWQAQARLVAQEPWWAAMQAVDTTALQDLTAAFIGALPAASESALEQPGTGQTGCLQAGSSRTGCAQHAGAPAASEAPPPGEPAPMVIAGAQGPLMGALTLPAASPVARLLVVPGQPQTRVGSHRLFVDLARGLAGAGIASLRVDIGGWGDSPGEAGPFEAAVPDIVAAARSLAASQQLDGGSAPLWLCGLCDGASAAALALPALQAAGIPVAGVALINPWVRSEASLGAAMVRGYYARRILAPEFWRRLLRGEVPVRHLVGDPLRHLAAGLGLRGRRSSAGATASAMRSPSPSATPIADLPAALLAALRRHRGALLTVLSGADLTADETEALIRGQSAWRQRLEVQGRVLRVPGADHSLSEPAHWAQAVDWLAAQIAECAGPSR
ncbi:MAG: hydrolase 1, exosortase A system-associated [Betaproteobacteria bacterium]|nr:hydrolase 1, exosortase A system-associated [Betaproteobacteria bacterium]